MKTIYKITAILSLLISFVGCNDDIDPTPKPIVSSELVFKSTSDFHQVNLDTDDTWYVASYPEWAVPMSVDGNMQDAIMLFVEDNFEDSERNGEMRVKTEKEEFLFIIRQRSRLTDDENAPIVSESTLSKTNGVGYGINVFNVASGGKYSFTRAIINPARLISTLGSVGEEDAYCSEKQYNSQTESYIGTTTSQVSTQLSVNAGIDVEITGFKASVEGKFSSTESTNMERAYAIREIKHIVGSRYLRPGIIRSLSAEGSDSVFVTDFRNQLKKIKQDPSDANIRRLIDRYGTHLIVHGTLGGELSLAMEMTSTEKISEMKIHAALDLSHEVISAGGSFDMDESQKEISKNTKISLTTYGGNNVYTIAPGTPFEDAMKQSLDANKLNDWVEAIKSEEALSLIDIKTYPIYDLMPDETSRDAVRNYIVNQYQKEKLGHGPMIYAVTGFNDPNTLYGYVEIPEINVRMEYYRYENMPGLANGNELPIIVYSGQIDDMNYDCGFFIGNSHRYPAKLRKNRDGSQTVEEFTSLPMQAISELYVDPTGKVTVAAPITENLSQVRFETIPSALSGNFVTNKYAAGSAKEPNKIAWRHIEGTDAIAVRCDLGREIDPSQYVMAFTAQMLVNEINFFFLDDDGFWLNDITVGPLFGDEGHETRFTVPKGTRYVDIYLRNRYDDDSVNHIDWNDNFTRLYFPIANITPPSWN